MKKQNQHYVQQLLLRRFQDKSGKIHAFDKWERRAFSPGTKAIASEINFYVTEVENQSISFEPIMCKVEDDATAPLQKVWGDRSIDGLSPDEGRRLAYYVALQSLRTRALRDTQDQINDLMKSVGANSKYVLADAEVKAASIFNLSIADEVNARLLDMCWMLAEPPDESTFYISDNPVVWTNFDHSKRHGLGEDGIQVFLPLSPTLLLCFLCPKLIRSFLHDPQREGQLRSIESGTPFCLDGDGLALVNRLQVSRSTRFLISDCSDFSLAKQVLTENPEFAKPTFVQLHGN